MTQPSLMTQLKRAYQNYKFYDITKPYKLYISEYDTEFP